MSIMAENWDQLRIPNNQKLCVRHVKDGMLEYIITNHIYKEDFNLYSVNDDMSLTKLETARMPSFKTLKNRKKKQQESL